MHLYRQILGSAIAIEAIPKLNGGIDPTSTQAAADFYGKVFQRVVVLSSAQAAEAAKLVENIYRNVNIALVNELRSVLSKMDIDIHEVLEAASTKPFGFSRFHPGPGVGGHCIPVDPKVSTNTGKSTLVAFATDGLMCSFLACSTSLGRHKLMASQLL